MRTLGSERVRIMGSAGDPPAPVGDSPTGMSEAITTKAMPGSAKNHLAIPSGESPNGTGESPVLPLMAFSYLLLACFLPVTLNAADPPVKFVNDGYGDFMFVPAGPFNMGDNFGDGESRERLVHVVDLDAYYIGSQSFDTGQLAGYYDGSKRGDFQTHNGASLYGVHDMAGSVMEWCQDWYSRDYYSISPKKNPKGPETGAYRGVRGGTFFMEAQDQRTYLRSASWPSLQTHRMTGFRAVREP